jgi:Zn finger protein HypA/HybF involved in hydrogenase expression
VNTLLTTKNNETYYMKNLIEVKVRCKKCAKLFSNKEYKNSANYKICLKCKTERKNKYKNKEVNF